MSGLPPEVLDPETAHMGWLQTSPSELICQAEQFDVWTPSYNIRRLLIEAVVQATPPGVIQNLCAKIAQRTQISPVAVGDLAMLLTRNVRLRPIDGPSQLAKRFLKELFADGTGLVSTVRGEIYGYDGRLWRALPEAELERHLLEQVLMRPELLIGAAPQRSARAAMRLIKVLQTRLAPWERGSGPSTVINTLSGELWIDQDAQAQLRPHRPESGLRALVPVHYDPAATCPRFDAAMTQIFSAAANPEAMVRHMLEVMGYAIQPKRDIPAIVCLVGGGANGKTSLLSLLQTLVGADQVYAGSGGALSDRFTLPNLSGRLLYVDDDLSEGVRLNDGLLKQMAEDKLMTARRAHAAGSVTFRASALPILAMNGAPRLNDSSYGLLRRLYVIPFDKRFEGKAQDPGLFEHIRTHELPGVLNRCLEGLQRLRARGRFDEPSDCLLAKAEWLEAANPLQGFLADACKPAVRGRVDLGDMHASMAAWCRAERLPLRVTRKTLARQLRSAGYRVDKVAGLARVIGVTLREPPASSARRSRLSAPTSVVGRRSASLRVEVAP